MTLKRLTKRAMRDISSHLQHMADCFKALFANKSSCVSTSIAITHPANEFKSIHALRKSINMVAMLTGDALLHHFRKGMYHSRIGSCTLLSLMYSCLYRMRFNFCGVKLSRVLLISRHPRKSVSSRKNFDQLASCNVTNCKNGDVRMIATNQDSC